MKVRCTYGRYLSSHIDGTLGTHIIHKYISSLSGHMPQYDTVYFPAPDGDVEVEVDGINFVLITEVEAHV